MVGHAPLDPEPESSDLARLAPIRIAPAARVAVASGCFHAECRAGLDHGSLERPHEWLDEQAASMDVDDRIGDELARPVVGHLATPLDPDDLDAAGGELCRCRQDMAPLGVSPQSQDRGVLQQEQLIRNSTGNAFVDEVVLELASARAAVQSRHTPRDGVRR